MIKETIMKMVSKFVVKKVQDRLTEVIKEDNKEVGEVTEAKEELTVTELLFDNKTVITKEMLEQFDYSSIPEPEILNPDAPRTAILVDDIVFTDIMYRHDLKKMVEQYGCAPYQDYKMVKCLGDYAGFQAYKYVVLEGNKIDVGVLDITLGHNFCIQDRMCVEVDGVDIAYHIKQACPDFKFLLCTAHTLNLNNTTIERYYNKLKDSLGIDLKSVYLNKNSYRVDKFYQLLYSHEH